MRPVVIAKALVLVLLGIYLALGLSAASKQARSAPVPPSSTGQEPTPCADRPLARVVPTTSIVCQRARGCAKGSDAYVRCNAATRTRSKNLKSRLLVALSGNRSAPSGQVRSRRKSGRKVAVSFRQLVRQPLTHSRHRPCGSIAMQQTNAV
jgi:hypothetical protein